jgi:hypothetical protein
VPHASPARTLTSSPGSRPAATCRRRWSRTGEKSSCHTWFGPVGSVANAALRRAASWRRSRWQVTSSSSPSSRSSRSTVAWETRCRSWRHIAHTPAVSQAGWASACRRAALRTRSRAGRGHGPRVGRAAPGAGLVATPGALGHADHSAEPRGRHARLDADHLEVREGPSRPSADFFHTRSSTAASPRAWVSSAASAASGASRVEGPGLPATRPPGRIRGTAAFSCRPTARIPSPAGRPRRR